MSRVTRLPDSFRVGMIKSIATGRTPGTGRVPNEGEQPQPIDSAQAARAWLISNGHGDPTAPYGTMMHAASVQRPSVLVQSTSVTPAYTGLTMAAFADKYKYGTKHMTKTTNASISADQFTKALTRLLKRQAKALDETLKFPEGTEASVIINTQATYRRQRDEIESAARAVEPFLRALGSARFAQVELS